VKKVLDVSNKIYSFILMACFILLSRNTLISANIIGFEKTYIFMLIICVPLIIKQIFSIKKNKNFSKNILILIIAILISIVLKLDFALYNISILLYITIAYLYFREYKKETIINNFIIVMTFLMVYSLIGTYIIKPALIKTISFDECMKIGRCFENINKTKILNLYFSFPVYITYYIRNFGIFTEPGIYQFYLIILLIIILFEKSINKIGIKIPLAFICILTILSTFSTAAYIVLVLILLAFIINLIHNSKIDKKIIIGCTLSSILLFSFGCSKLIEKNSNIRDMYGMIKIKITSHNTSTDTRTLGMLDNLNEFAKSPLIGNDISKIMNNKLSAVNTNFSFLAIYGIVPGIVLIMIEYLFCTIFSNKKIVNVLIFIGILFSINNHFFLGSQSFWIIIMTGLYNEERMWKGIKKNESNVDCQYSLP